MLLGVDGELKMTFCIEMKLLGVTNWDNFAKSSVIRQEQISKRVLQENKAGEIFKKSEYFLPPDMHTCVSGGKKCSFFRKLAYSIFL